MGAGSQHALQTSSLNQSNSNTASHSSVTSHNKLQPNTVPANVNDTNVPLKAAYRLGAGDKIRLIIFKEPDLSGEFDVDGNGIVSLPLIGQVSAKNVTLRELEQKIATKFQNGYLKDPKVSIEVLNYRPFFILGEVKKGGEYPFKAGLTVRDAVAMAGGYTYRANNGKVYIRRANTEVEKDYPLSRKVLVYPGDNVRVPERFF
ncbi:MAG: polysaccharide biosynthesis/export family protein [Pseudomonadota bacterium]